MHTKEQEKYYPFKLVRCSAYAKESEMLYFETFEKAKEYADGAPPWDYVCIIKGNVVFENQD